MAKKKKITKFIEFRHHGVTCVQCASVADFLGCNKHLNEFPIMTDENYVRISSDRAYAHLNMGD